MEKQPDKSQKDLRTAALILAILGAFVSAGIGWTWRKTVLFRTSPEGQAAFKQATEMLRFSDKEIAETKAETAHKQRTYPLLFVACLLALSGGVLTYWNGRKLGPVSPGVAGGLLLLIAVVMPALVAPEVLWITFISTIPAVFCFFVRLPNRHSMPAFLYTYIQSLKTHDVDLIAGTVSEDLEFVSKSKTLGKEEFLAMLRALYAGFPDWNYDNDAPEIRDGIIAIRWRQGGTHTGDFALPGMPTIPPTGKKVTIPEHFFFYKSDGEKIIEIRPEDVPGGAPRGILEQLGVEAPPL